MPIPRMTPEDRELEKQHHQLRNLARVPKNKRWIVELVINCFIVWGYIEKLLWELLGRFKEITRPFRRW